jgi:hypothetical protein
MPRTKAVKNYNNVELLSSIEFHLPIGSLGWDKVASRYQSNTQELELREGAVIKRHFMEKLCEKGQKKPTGKSAPNQLLARAQMVLKLILEKENSASYGGENSEDEDEDSDSEDEEEADDEVFSLYYLQILMCDVVCRMTTSKLTKLPSNV